MLSKGKKRKSLKISTLVGETTEINGDISFTGGLHVEGCVKGNVSVVGDPQGVVIVSEDGRIEGEVKVPNVVLNGTVVGNVHATQQVELAANARVTGNVYYHLLEMAMGAEVNGSLVHIAEEGVKEKINKAVGVKEVNSLPETESKEQVNT